MKHIKLFESFKEGSHEYRFSFDIMKTIRIKDDGYWTWGELSEYLRDECGCNIKEEVARENEVDRREVSDDMIEEFANKMGWEKFKQVYGLDSEEYEINNIEYDALMDDFNNSELEKYFNSSKYGFNFDVLSIRVIKPEKKIRGEYNKIHGIFTTNAQLNEEEMDAVKEYISGQCSDGWGEGFMQNDEEEKRGGVKFYTNLVPWWMDKKGTYRKPWNISVSRK